MSASSNYSTTVQELYIAYFGRPADATGLANFESTLATLNAPTNINSLTAAYASNPAIQALIDSFGTSNESTTLYGSVNSSNTNGIQNFVTSVFQHVLNRAPATEGLDFWSLAIASGSLSLGNAALAIAAGALTNTSGQGLIDRATITNKTAVASDFTAATVSQQVTSEYAGANAAQIGRNLLSAVTDNTLLSSYIVTVNSAVANLSTAGSSATPGIGSPFTLTTGTDNDKATTGSNIFNGTLDNTAGLSLGGAAATFTTGDQLLGGGISSTFNLTDSGLSTTMILPSSVTVSGMTAINISSTEGIGTQNFSSWGAAPVVTISASSGADNVTVNSQSILNLTDTGSSGAIVTNGGTSVTISTDGNHSVLVNGGTTTTSVAITGGSNITVLDAHYGTTQVNSIATVSLSYQAGPATIESNDLTTLNITGDNNFVVTASVLDATSQALAINLDNDQNTTIHANSATTLTINTNLVASSGITLSANNATTLTFNDTASLTLSSLSAPDATSIVIEGGAPLSADMTGAASNATISVQGSLTPVNITLGAGQSFNGVASGRQETVTLNAMPLGVITGGNASNNILILQNVSSTSSNDTLSASNFPTLEFSGTTTGTINLLSNQSLEFNNANNALTLTNASPGTIANFIGNDSGSFTVKIGSVYTSASIGDMYIGDINSAPTQVGSYTSYDINGNGADAFNINSYAASGQTNVLGSLQAWGSQSASSTANVLSIGGNASLKITQMITQYNPTVGFNNISEGTFTLAGGLSDTILSTLTFNGVSAINLASESSTSQSQQIISNSTGAVAISTISDANLTSLNVNNAAAAAGTLVTIGSSTLANLKTLTLSSGVAITVTGDAVTSGISVSGSADNAAVSLTSTGSTASGVIDNINLGNGDDQITLGAGAGGSVQSITLGNGIGNEVTTSSTGIVSVAVGTGMDTINASGNGVGLTVQAGNGTNQITASGTNDTLNFTLGTGANTVNTSTGAVGIITLGVHTAPDSITVSNLGVTGIPSAMLTINGINASNSSDTINFTNGLGSTITQVTAANVTSAGGSTNSLASWMATATGLNGVVAQHAEGLTWFQFQGNTYLVDTAGAADGGTLSAADTVIELAGTSYNLTSANLHNNTLVFSGNAAPQVANATFTLTTGNDSFTGTAQTNTFNAVLNDGAATTLNAGDALTGAGGVTSNILNITDDGQGAIGSLPAAILSDITTINISSSEAISGTDGAPLEIMTLAGEGLTTFNVLSSVGNANIALGSTTGANIVENGSAFTLLGGSNVIVTDANFNTANANTLASVTLTEAGSTIIQSNALTQLTLTFDYHNVTVDAAAGNRTLNLTLNSVNSGTISDATATAVNITDSVINNANVLLQFAGATSIAYNNINNSYNSQTSMTWLDTFTGSNVTSFTISGAGNVFANLSGLNSAANINAQGTTGNIYLTLAPGQSYVGSSSSGVESTVTMSTIPTGTLNGGAGLYNELVLNNFSSNASLNTSAITHFSNLGLSGTTGGTFNMINAQEFNTYTLQNDTSTGALTFAGTPASLILQLMQSFNNTITVQSVTAAASDSDQIWFPLASTPATTPLYVSQVVFEDNSSTSAASVTLANFSGVSTEIGTLSATSQLSIIGTSESIQVDQFNTSATAFTLNNGGNATTIVNFNDNNLTTLNVDATNLGTASNIVISNFNSTVSSFALQVVHPASGLPEQGAFAITNFNDTSLVSATFTNDGTVNTVSNDGVTIGHSTQTQLTTLNLSGYVAIGITGDTVSTGITVSGSTDDANVSFSSTGVTANGVTDSVTLGNGNDTVTLGAGVAGSIHSISLGTGSDTVTDNTLGATTISITGTAGGTETVSANSAASVNITLGDSTNTVSVLGSGTTGTINVGGGANTMSLGNGAGVSVTLGTHTAADAITVGTSGTSTSAIVQIAGLNNAGSDSIIFAGDQHTLSAVTSVTTQNITASGLDSAQLASWIAVADGYNNLVSGAAHSVTSFVFNGNTYLLESVAGQTADHGTMAAGNTVVELTGTNYTFTQTTGGAGGVLHLLG